MDRRGLNRQLYKASVVHQIVTILQEVVHPDFIQKALARQQLLVWQRAVAFATGTVFKRFLSSLKLSSLYSDKMDSPESVASAIQRIENDIRGVNMKPLYYALTLSARHALRSTQQQMGHGKRLPKGWFADPEGMMRRQFPVQFREMTRNIENLKSSYAKQAVRTLKRAKSAEDARERLTKLSVRHAQVFTTTEGAHVVNAVARKVARDSGVSRRKLITAGDKRVDKTCLGDAARGWVTLRRRYPSGAMHPPQQHPNCRCREEFGKSKRKPSYVPA